MTDPFNPLGTQTPDEFGGPIEEDIYSDPFSELRPGRAIIERGVMPQIENTLANPNAPYRDPFIAMMERFARAGETAGGRGDEFYQHLEARKAQAQATNASEQVGNPASIAGKRLGGSVSVFPNANKSQTPVMSWQADDDSETGPVTVTIGLVTPLAAQGPPISSLRPYAVLVWGSYGSSFNAELDVGRGVQLVVNASSMAISLGLDADSNDSINSANLGAYISFRPCVRTAKLMRTRYIDGLVTGGGNAMIIDVPMMANFILPVQMSDVAGQVQLDLLDTENEISSSLQISNGSQVTPIPLTSDIVNVRVTGISAATQNVRLPFELSI